MTILRGTVRSYDAITHTASVQVWGANTTYTTTMYVSHAIETWQVVAGQQCAVLLFDESNTADGCVIAIYGGTPEAPA